MEQSNKELLAQEEMNTRKDEYYHDWFSDNKAWLISEFLEEQEELFNKFCRAEFRDYCEEKFS